MAIDEAEFNRLKKKANAARQARDKASGQLDVIMERLKEDFGCRNIEEAETLATKLDRDAAKAEKVYNVAVNKFEEEWNERI